MKDITIKATMLKKELTIFGICFAVANLINVYAIISRETRWIELIAMLHVVLILSGMFYGLVFGVRFIGRVFKKKNN
jgi:hypothetical protein